MKRSNVICLPLEEIPVAGDGNCCFRIIIKCLHHRFLGNSENNHNDDISRYIGFIKSLGLGIKEDKDTLHLRLLMCQEISSKSEEYQQWLGLTAEQLSSDLNLFRQQDGLTVMLVILQSKYAATFCRYPSLL